MADEGKRRRARQRRPEREEERIEPGGGIGETRELGPGGSAADLPGKVPRTRVVVHPPRRDGA